MVQWQEATANLPAGTRFPEVWPPQLRRTIERRDRPIAKVDVEDLLEQYANDPLTVLVTTDPNGRLGWIPIDGYFIT